MSNSNPFRYFKTSPEITRRNLASSKAYRHECCTRENPKIAGERALLNHDHFPTIVAFFRKGIRPLQAPAFPDGFDSESLWSRTVHSLPYLKGCRRGLLYSFTVNSSPPSNGSVIVEKPLFST